jgi:hypothetical protein
MSSERLLSLLEEYRTGLEASTLSQAKMLLLGELFVKDSLLKNPPSRQGPALGTEEEMLKYTFLGAFIYRFVIPELAATGEESFNTSPEV